MTDSTHRPVLIIIAGPNGSGKTTITSQILQHNHYFGSRTLAFLFITEKGRNNRKKQKLARGRSLLFFITEKNRNCSPTASACGNLNVNANANFFISNYFGSLALAVLSSLSWLCRLRLEVCSIGICHQNDHWLR